MGKVELYAHSTSNTPESVSILGKPPIASLTVMGFGNFSSFKENNAFGALISILLKYLQ